MMNKTKLTLGLAMSAIMLATVLAPQDAMAHKRKHRHSHHRTHKSSSSYSASSALASKVEMLEAQLRATQDEVTALRSAGGTATASNDTAKVQELDAWMQESKAKPAKAKDNMVFFRGGFARNDQRHIATTSNLSGDDCLVSGIVGCTSSDKDGWYFGAGFDFSLDDDLFGLSPNTELLAELMFDYNEFGEFTGNVTGAINVPNSASTATQSQLRLTAAPKIKFMKGSAFRPWIIPAGFALNVISPPSQLNTITHLMPAIHFGAGADYNIWRNLYVGADVRYNYALNKLDGTNTNGLTAGGYLGIGF
jgi:opacity protein-like surface antigen